MYNWMGKYFKTELWCIVKLNEEMLYNRIFWGINIQLNIDIRYSRIWIYCAPKLGCTVKLNGALLYNWIRMYVTTAWGYIIPLNEDILFDWMGEYCTSQLGYSLQKNEATLYNWIGTYILFKLIGVYCITEWGSIVHLNVGILYK